MVIGIAIGFVTLIVSGILKKQIGMLMGVCISVVFVLCFLVDISIDPIKNIDAVSQSAESVSLEQMINDYAANNLNAQAIYEDNRYVLTAEIVSVERAGLLDKYNGYIVSMKTPVDDFYFHLKAQFQSNMKEDVMQLRTGDLLTFTGTCVSPQIWHNCTIVRSEKNSATSSTEKDIVDTSVSFAEIYKEFKRNELVAEERYSGNRYPITAKIIGIETDGLNNTTGGATLTMEYKVDNTIVYFYAEFEKDQETALKQVSVGDTVTFNGTCLSYGTWVDCEMK